MKTSAPKVLFFLNSHIPASICAIPPYNNAIGRTTASSFGVPTMPALNRLSMNVVSANAASPSGPGSAIDSAAGRDDHHQFRWGRWPLLGQFDPHFVCLILRYGFRRHVALLGVKNWRPAEPALRAA